MKTLMTTSAIVALLSVPVFAQGDDDQIDGAPPVANEIVPAEPSEIPEVIEEQLMAPDAAEAPMTGDAPVVAGENRMFLDRQNDNEDLASSWIGETIYNGNDESLGDVNDLLFAENGEVGAVIVGVGGFLGIGEKDVAVPFAALDPRTDEDGDITLYLQATAEQLEAAPEFLTLAEIQAEERARAAEVEFQQNTNAPPAL